VRRVSAVALVLALGAGSAAARPVDYRNHVTITRDDWGIAHVHGQTDADAVFGTIYAQAEDDFNRIERNYLTALGRTAEADGEKAVWADLRQRLFIDETTLKADYARSPPWLKSLMDAWAAGLNYYLETHPDVHPAVIHHFEPWMALSFTEGSIGGDIERAPLTQLEAFYDHQALALNDDEKGLPYREPQGSNGIAISPGRSADGHALLWINPHTSFFFRSELEMSSDQGLMAYGAATWGQFFIYQGFNGDVGWMHTSSGVDSVDEFAETIVKTADGRLSYRYGNELRPVTQKTVTIAWRTADGTLARRRFTTYATHHGPIIRAENGKWIAMALLNAPIAALEQSWLRTKTHDLAGFLKVARLKANSSNNTLFADRKGETAYLHPQFVPLRDNRFDYTKPVDGSDPAADWKGLTALDALPTVVNPKTGWVYNSNNAPWTSAGPDSPRAADYPKYMDQVGENARGWHATKLLNGLGEPLTPQGVIRLAFDPWLPAFDRLVPPLRTAYDRLPADDPRRARLEVPVAALSAWDKRWGLSSRETSLAVFWGEALWALEAPRAKAAGVNTLDYMIADSSDDDRLNALIQAVDRLTADFGGWQVAWGEINRFQRNDGAIIQTFDDAKPSTPVPFTSSQWGSLAAFGAKRYPGTRRYYGTVGNSFLAVVDFGPRVLAWAVTAGGESGHPDSPHFEDQVDRYAAGRLRPVYIYPDDLKGHVERVYKPGN
jgi:acyl-homoserine-lactone acylase